MRNDRGPGETRQHRAAAYDHCIYFDPALFLLDGLSSGSNPLALAGHCMFRDGAGFRTTWVGSPSCFIGPNPSLVLLVVIVPRIVPLEYISTTLGLHKSVRTPASAPTIILKPYVQLEQTGTTITQTLSGLWLDSKKEETKSGSITIVSEKDGPRLQWLLNGFFFVNILHLAAIWGLSYLNEKKRNAPKDVTVQSERENEDEERLGESGSVSGIDDPSSSPELSPRSPSDQTPEGDHTASPLLHPRSASLVYQNYGTHPRPSKSQQDASLMGAATPAEVRRGKLFASLCATTVVFAWGLFLITSFIKIRSKREREGHP